MKAYHPCLLLILSATPWLSGAVGCTRGGALAFWQKDSHDASTMLADTETLESSAGIDLVSERLKTNAASDTPVRSVSHQIPQPPALSTLASGESLSDMVQQASGPVLLDFYADWCGPCRTQSKILHDMEATAAEHQVRIIKINVDQHPELARQYQVASLPTLVMIKDGEIAQRQSGLAKADRLETWMR